jgi:three-Cys-motif partner protein
MTERNATGQLLGADWGGDWTEEKLAILQEYLGRYNTVLKNKAFTRVYIDAFAGAGYREKRRKQSGVFDLFEETSQDEAQRFLKGSAKRALEVVPAFHKYIFVESDPDNVEALERLKSEHKDQAAAIRVEKADANSFVREYCRSENWREVRAVLFLDPFATEVEWSTIEAVANTRAIDLWILFPLMAVNRLLARDPAKACKERLDAIFGTREWFGRFYRNRKMDDIFGGSLDIVEKECDFDGISGFFLERLRAIFAGVAEKPRVLRNSTGSPMFQFFFAASNVKGAPIALRIANHLLEHKKWE